MLTLHSLLPLAVQIEEASARKDYDEVVNRQVIERFAEELEAKDNYRLLSKFSE